MANQSRGVHGKNNDSEIRKEIPNFAYSFRPVYYFLRFFGLIPFSIIYNSNDEIQKCKITKFDGFWFVISWSMYLLMVSSIKIMHVPTSFSILGIIFGILSFTYSFSAIVVNMWNRYKFIKILKQITIFDIEVMWEIWMETNLWINRLI